MQDVCLHFEFARHFESDLALPSPFYMRMRTMTSDEHSIVTILLSTHIIFSSYSFTVTCLHTINFTIFFSNFTTFTNKL